MRFTISIFLASLAISTSGYLAWRLWQPNLNGHWHILGEQLGENQSSHDWMETLDITKGNVVYLNYDHFNPSPTVGNVSRLYRNMYIGPSCLNLELNYQPDGNTLHLEIPNHMELTEPYQITAVRSIKCPHSWRPE
jgi:hypothetical protein